MTTLQVSIIIVCLNGRDRIAMPLDALGKSSPPPDEVIVVDNGSSDGTGNFVRQSHPEVRLITQPQNLGFAGGNNAGIREAQHELIVLLNDDTEPRTDWLKPLIREFENDPALGIAGCLLLYPDNETVQHCGGIVHPNGLTDHIAWGKRLRPGHDPGPAREVPYVTGAAMAIRRELIEEIGELDPEYWPIYFEEVDFCARARRAGWKVSVVPRSIVIHHESQTTGRLSPGFLRKYHRNRWRYILRNRRGPALRKAIRAEIQWWRQHRPWDHLRACIPAYAWAAWNARAIRQSLQPPRCTPS